MQRSYPWKFWVLFLLALPATLAVSIFNTSITAVAPPTTATPTPIRHTSIPTTAPATPTFQSSTPVIATALPAATPAVPAATPLAQRTIRIGLQAGHWKSNELPNELARLRTSSGAAAGGYTESQITTDIAQRVAKLMQSLGVAVDVLPATVPPGYQADAFVALHTDGSRNTNARGFKLAPPWRASRASHHLLNSIKAEYKTATGLPDVAGVTINMRGYYAFSYFRHRHAIAKTTPAVIVEMGFLTNEIDRKFMTTQPDHVAIGIANGIIRYLNERNPEDQAARQPAELPIQRPAQPGGVTLRTAPRDDAQLLQHINANQRLLPYQEYNDWYHVVINGTWHLSGWVRKDELIATDEPLVLPSENP